MNIKTKFEGLPYILWINLDKDKKRRQAILDQFNKYNINKHIKIDGINGEKVYKHINGIDIRKLIGCRNSHLKAIRYFVENCNKIGDYCIIAEDDLSFDYVKYWDRTFSDYISIFENVDWDIIQMSLLINDKDLIRFAENFNFNIPYKREINFYSANAYLINIQYAKKLLKYYENEIIVNGNINDLKSNRIFVADDLFIFNENTYTLPLFTFNNKFNSNLDHNFDGHVHSYYWLKYIYPNFRRNSESEKPINILNYGAITTANINL